MFLETAVYPPVVVDGRRLKSIYLGDQQCLEQYEDLGFAKMKRLLAVHHVKQIVYGFNELYFFPIEGTERYVVLFSQEPDSFDYLH